MKFSWQKKKPMLGLDIGARTIKGLKLKEKDGKVFIDHFIFYDLADGNARYPIVNGLTETLKALVEVGGFKGSPVAACVDDSSVATFDMSFPPMPAGELNEAIGNEIEPRLGFPLDDASIDHVVLGRTSEGGEESVSVRAFCARLSEVRGFAEILAEASLKPASVDVAMLSNVAMLKYNGYLVDDTFMVIVDLGETKTSLALARGTTLLVTNTIQIGFGTINRRLQQNSGMTYLEAEKIKIKSAQQHEESSQVYVTVDEVYLELFQQMQRSFEYYRVSTQGKAIEQVLIMGGGAQYPSVRSTIEATCGITTVVVNPFRNIEIFEPGKVNSEKIGQIAAHMGTAVGLALRGLDGG